MIATIYFAGPAQPVYREIPRKSDEFCDRWEALHRREQRLHRQATRNPTPANCAAWQRASRRLSELEQS